MKRFTDSEGNEFIQPDLIGMPNEVLNWFAKEEYQLIKPVVREEKKTWFLIFQQSGNNPNIDEQYLFTEPQATPVSEAIKSLMEVIQLKDNGLDFVKYPPTHLINMIVEARKALGSDENAL